LLSSLKLKVLPGRRKLTIKINVPQIADLDLRSVFVVNKSNLKATALHKRFGTDLPRHQCIDIENHLSDFRAARYSHPASKVNIAQMHDCVVSPKARLLGWATFPSVTT
jgi:hypothetical protein